MKPLKFVVVYTLLLSLSWTARGQSSSDDSQKLDPDELVILATTDFHSEIDRAEGFASAIHAVRNKYKDHVVHLDGGDLFQGGLEATLSKGRVTVALYNELKVD